MYDPTDPLNDLQRRTIDTLLPDIQPVDFGRLGAVLRDVAHAELGPLASRWSAVSDRQLRVTKHRLTVCELRDARDSDDQFRWTPARAEGTLLGMVWQLALFNPGARTPDWLWDRAVDMAVADQSSLGNWIAGLFETSDWAELRLRVLSQLVRFQEVFPELPRWSRPCVEGSHQLRVGSVVVTGKVDLQVGADVKRRAGVTFVETKRTSVDDATMDELRLYALLRAIRLGIPPRRLVAVGFADAELLVEDVTEPMLRAELRKLVGGVERLVELGEGRSPGTQPSRGCWWCPLVDGCHAGSVQIGRSANPAVDTTTRS